MSFAIPQVFISSTSEFAEERKALAQSLKNLPELDFHPFIYEEEAAGPRSPEQHCQAMLDRSEIIVLILGSSYGSAFPGRPTSIVEWEYEYARNAGKELKGYLRDPLGPEVHPSQAQFVARARAFRSGTWLRTFSQASQLVAHVVEDVKRWRLDSWQALQELASERKQWKDRIVLGACALVAVATVGGVVGGTMTGVPAERLALVLGSGMGMFAALGWLLEWDPV